MKTVPLMKAAMKASDVVFIPTTCSLSHTKARMAASEAGARIASMPGITEDMMTVGGMTADYGKVSELSWKLTELLDKTKKVLKTVHIALGMNIDMGGKIDSKTHNDGIILNPTVKFDDRTVLEQGEIMV